LAIVSGIMVFISIDEILPAAHKADNKGHAITIGIILGFFVMIGTLIMLNTL
jgi:zinc transporter ZupT